MYRSIHQPRDSVRQEDLINCSYDIQSREDRPLGKGQRFCRGLVVRIIQSAQDFDRIIIVLAYSRKLAKMTKRGKHTAATIFIIKPRLTGLVELGTTPGGGRPPGRSLKPLELSIP